MTIALCYMLLLGMTALALAVVLVPVLRNPALSKRQARRVAGIIAALYLVLGLGMYSWLGAPRLLPMLEHRNERVDRLMNEITDSLEKIKQDTNDLGAWVTLGTNFLETGQIDSAVGAFKQAVVVSGGEPKLILAYAKAQVMQADGTVTDDAARGLQMVLMLQPKNPDAKYLMALRKLQTGDTENAMKEMKALYHSLPEDSPVKGMIDWQIGRE